MVCASGKVESLPGFSFVRSLVPHPTIEWALKIVSCERLISFYCQADLMKLDESVLLKFDRPHKRIQIQEMRSELIIGSTF